MFSAERTGQKREWIVLSNNDPLSRADLQIDQQTAMKALHFCQIFFVNFLQFG